MKWLSRRPRSPRWWPKLNSKAEGESAVGISEATVLDASVSVTAPATALKSEVLPLTVGLPTDIRVWLFPGDVVSGTELELKLYSGETLLDTQLVTVDRQGPDWVELRVGAGNGVTLPVTVSATPGDGVSLGRDWTWEQSAFSYTTDSGAIFKEPGATDGLLWYAQPDAHEVGVWYGPYTGTLPHGRSYRAVFRLRVPDLERPYLKETGEAELVCQVGCRPRRGGNNRRVQKSLCIRFAAPSRFSGILR